MDNCHKYCIYYDDLIDDCVAKRYGRKMPVYDDCSSCPTRFKSHVPIKPEKDRLFRCKPKDMEGQMNILTLDIEDDNDRGCPQGGFSWDNPSCVRCYELKKRNYSKKSCGSYYNKPKHERKADTHKRRKRTLSDVQKGKEGLTWGGKNKDSELYED